MVAPFALDVLAALEGWVFHALRINLEVFRSHREISPVNTVINLAVGGCPLVVAAQLALELEVASAIFTAVLLRVEHVVALGAKAHAFELLRIVSSLSLGRLG